jgi:hypothetical protein
MKMVRLLLVISVLGNLVLLGLSSHASHSTSAATERTPRAFVARPSADAPEVRGNHWVELASDDFALARDRLQAAGFPERIVRAILAALIAERFEARERAIYYRPDVTYWQEALLPRTPELEAAVTELDRERRRLMRELVGDYYAPGEYGGAYMRQMFGPFSPAKLSAVRAIVDEFSALRNQLPFDREKRGALEREMREQLARLLTPGELEQHELRRGNIATNARMGLDTFNATEAEYRAIHGAYRPFIEATQMPSGAPVSLRATVHLQIEAALGPERYADYVQASNPQHQDLNRLVVRLDLPLSAARQVVALREDVSRQAATLRANRDLTLEQRNAQLSALANQTSARLTSVLGVRGFEVYQVVGGHWLEGLKR